MTQERSWPLSPGEVQDIMGGVILATESGVRISNTKTGVVFAFGNDGLPNTLQYQDEHGNVENIDLKGRPLIVPNAGVEITVFPPFQEPPVQNEPDWKAYRLTRTGVQRGVFGKGPPPDYLK